MDRQKSQRGKGKNSEEVKEFDWTPWQEMIAMVNEASSGAIDRVNKRLKSRWLSGTQRFNLESFKTLLELAASDAQSLFVCLAHIDKIEQRLMKTEKTIQKFMEKAGNDMPDMKAHIEALGKEISDPPFQELRQLALEIRKKIEEKARLQDKAEREKAGNYVA